MNDGVGVFRQDLERVEIEDIDRVEGEARVAGVVLDVRDFAEGQVVDACDRVLASEQPIQEVRADHAGNTRDEYVFHTVVQMTQGRDLRLGGALHPKPA